MKAKKIFKGMTAAAVAAVLAASMVPMTAFAAAVTTDTQEITFNSNVTNLTYKIYQVATATVAAGGTAYDYTLVAPFTDVAGYETIDKIAAVDSSDAAAKKDLADALAAKVDTTSTNPTTPLATVAGGEKASLAPGLLLDSYIWFTDDRCTYPSFSS